MEIILRATAIYFFLFLMARSVGKRELAEMTAFELVLLVTMGDLIQQGVTQEDMSVTGAFLAVGTITFWIVVLGYVAFRFRAARPALEGLPAVVIQRGQAQMEVLRVERITLDELKEAARNHGIADLADIDLAVLEPDGKFSFLTAIQQTDAASDDKHLG